VASPDQNRNVADPALPLSKKRSLYRICMMFGSFCCCCDVVEEKPKPKAEESSKNEGKVNVVSPEPEGEEKEKPSDAEAGGKDKEESSNEEAEGNKEETSDAEGEGKDEEAAGKEKSTDTDAEGKEPSSEPDGEEQPSNEEGKGEEEPSKEKEEAEGKGVSTSKSWEETAGGSVAPEQLRVDIGTRDDDDDDDDGEEKSFDQLERVHQDRSKALSRPKLQAKKEEDHLKSELKLEPAEMKGAERRISRMMPSDPSTSSRRLSLQRSQSNMTSRRSSILNNLGEIVAVERPPRTGQHPDYPFENAVFQGGGAKVSIDHIYHMTCYISVISNSS